MKNTLKLSFRKGDWIAILLVLALALGVGAAYVPHKAAGQDAVVQIYQDGKLLKELPLFSNQSLEIGGKYHNTVLIEQGKVCIAESNCPGADCVHSGTIDRPGRSIVCLPNRVELRIAGSGDVDFVVG